MKIRRALQGMRWKGMKGRAGLAGLCGLVLAAVLILIAFACPTPPLSPAQDAIDPQKAQLKWRYIGINGDPSQSCPVISGWTVEPVRSDGGTRFCIYTSSNNNPLPPQRPIGLLRLDSDTMAIAPAGRLAEAIRQPLTARFKEEVGRAGVDHLPINSEGRVRLAFLDTLPDYEGSPSSFIPVCPGEHGDFLRRVGRDLTCGSQGACATLITSRLALPVVTFNAESKSRTVVATNGNGCGGSIGSLVNLSDAIRAEVEAWKANREEDQTPHLILNLSLGWDPVLFEHTALESTELDAGVQLVHEALEIAQRAGALVFAAVGNDRSGPNPTTGALLPAGWEILGGQRPLVYAVGGLGSHDRPLNNARRQGARPSLAAYGDHAAVLDAEAKFAYTGTSVSTAVVSSIAAVLWNAQPQLDAAGVVAHLRANGSRVGAIDFSLGRNLFSADSPVSQVSRISLCSTLAALAPDVECPAPSPEPLALSRLVEGLMSPLPLPAGLSEQTVDGCDGRSLWLQLESPREPEQLCPETKLPDRQSEPWLYPQPGGPPCPNCIETGPPPSSPSRPHFLYLEIRDDWNRNGEDGQLLSAILEVQREGARTISRFMLVPPRSGGFSAGDAAAYTLPMELFSDSAYSVAINWHIRLGGRSYSTRTPILVSR